MTKNTAFVFSLLLINCSIYLFTPSPYELILVLHIDVLLYWFSMFNTTQGDIKPLDLTGERDS
jgi:hypothetical protein